MLRISNNVTLQDEEIELSAIRAQGSGGQKVNKTSSAIHLRFNIRGSSLPAFYKERLLKLRDRRITDQGDILIKAQRFRTQEKNREDALQRLAELIRGVAITQKKRIATRPTRASQKRRLNEKARRGRAKSMRGRVRDED